MWVFSIIMLSMATMFSMSILISWDSYVETAKYLLYAFLFAFATDYVFVFFLVLISLISRIL